MTGKLQILAAVGGEGVETGEKVMSFELESAVKATEGNGRAVSRN